VSLRLSRVLALGLGLLHCSNALAGARPDPVQLQTFEFAWKRVGEMIPAVDLQSVDWEAERARLLPRAQAASSAAELRPVLTELLGSLDASHFAVIPGAVYDGSGPTLRGGDGDLGIEIAPLDDALVVVRVPPTGLAAAVKPGWLLQGVGELDLLALSANLQTHLPEAPKDRAETLWRAGSQALRGPPGAPVTLRLLDGEDKPQTLTLSYRAPTGDAAALGHLPAQHVDFEARILPQGPGYVRFNLFLLPAAQHFEAAVRDFRENEVQDIILDLRGNPGGIIQLARGLAGWLVADKDRSLGRLQMDGGDLNLVVHPRPDGQRLDGKLAILVDARSMSTSEVLAAGLQELGRARIFGEATPGRCLPSLIEALPNGDRLQLAFGDLRSPSGRRVEGVGVLPDQPSPLSRAALLQGRDPALDAAIAWITANPEPAP
jgi:carboxyl-terminal processing protease